MLNPDSRLTRRQALEAGVLATAGILVPVGLAAGPLAAPALADAISLTPEQEEGPFYVALERIRSNIVLGQAGVPLELTISILDADTGGPVAAAAVDIWQCNALGVYSDESSEQTVGETYLRGVQLTDSRGRVRFRTIYPGHYAGRATHIHAKVHIGGAAGTGSYSGGHVAHTGQMFFDDAISTEVYKLRPYRGDHAARVLDTADRVYTQQGGSKSKLILRRLPGSLASHGFAAAVAMAVDPDATPAAVGPGSAEDKQ